MSAFSIPPLTFSLLQAEYTEFSARRAAKLLALLCLARLPRQLGPLQLPRGVLFLCLKLRWGGGGGEYVRRVTSANRCANRSVGRTYLLALRLMPPPVRLLAFPVAVETAAAGAAR